MLKHDKKEAPTLPNLKPKVAIDKKDIRGRNITRISINKINL
jgi:hypothetical protein